MGPEAKVERYLKKRVKETGGFTRKIRWLDRVGAPDRLVWWHFPTVALVEVKRPGIGLDPRSLQSREVGILRGSGWPVFVVASDAEVDLFIAGMLNRLDELKQLV